MYFEDEEWKLYDIRLQEIRDSNGLKYAINLNKHLCGPTHSADKTLTLYIQDWLGRRSIPWYDPEQEL
jgi:hypothetical protein